MACLDGLWVRFKDLGLPFQGAIGQSIRSHMKGDRPCLFSRTAHNDMALIHDRRGPSGKREGAPSIQSCLSFPPPDGHVCGFGSAPDDRVRGKPANGSQRPSG